MQTPGSLLNRLGQASDPEAWSRFVDLYTPLLFHWANRLDSDPNNAADLVQELFLILLQKMQSFSYKPEESFRSWLRTIMLNRWRDRCRERQRRQTHEQIAAQSRPTEEEPVDFFNEADYLKQLVQRVLELVQPEFQTQTWQAFVEHGLKHRSAPDVAKELGTSANVVYQATFRVMRRVRIELDGLVDFPTTSSGRLQ
jgi:RNA polymerase sigma-70 factor, ECF subfamily